MLLLHPPVTRPSAPPAGLALLAGQLGRRGVPHAIRDLNLDALLGLAACPPGVDDTWTRRAARRRADRLAALRGPDAYVRPALHTAAIRDLERLLAVNGRPAGVTVSLTDYHQAEFSPHRSGDLIRAACQPEANPFAPWLADGLLAAAERFRPSVCAVSVTFRHQALGAFALIGLIRRLLPGVRVALGGGLVTSWMRRPGWTDPFAGLVDRCVAGPGADELAALAGMSPPAASLGSDDPYEPDLTGFPWDEYLSPVRVLPVALSRGCWWQRCAFCAERSEAGPYQAPPPRRAAELAGRLVARYRPGLVHLLDDALAPALLRRLVDAPPGARWHGMARFGADLADPDFAQALAGSGCVLLQLGLESADPAVLAGMGKGLDPAVAGRVLRALREAGVATWVYLLFGTPWEDEAAARRTLDFCVTHAPWIDFLNLALFHLPRGGAEQAGLRSTGPACGDLSLNEGFIHPRGWGRATVRRFLDTEFRRHPLLAPIVRRTPAAFTSDHAPFFGVRSDSAAGGGTARTAWGRSGPAAAGSG